MIAIYKMQQYKQVLLFGFNELVLLPPKRPYD